MLAYVLPLVVLVLGIFSIADIFRNVSPRQK